LLVGGRAPIGGGGLIRLLTLIPDAESPRLSLSTIPDGAIATHTRGSGLVVGLGVTSGDIDIEIDGVPEMLGVRDIEGLTDNERLGEDVIDRDGVVVIDDICEILCVPVIEGVRVGLSVPDSLTEGVRVELTDSDAVREEVIVGDPLLVTDTDGDKVGEIVVDRVIDSVIEGVGDVEWVGELDMDLDCDLEGVIVGEGDGSATKL